MPIGSLDQRSPKFNDLGLVNTCTGRSNLCAPVSGVNGLSRILGRTLSEDESIALVDKIVRGSGIALKDVINRGFWPFEFTQALDRFFASNNINAQVRGYGVHSFADNWDSKVFDLNSEKRQLPNIHQLSQFLSKSDAFTIVNFLGFKESEYAFNEFDPRRALEAFQAGKINLAHYLVIDKVLDVRDSTLVVSAVDPMNGPVEFEIIPFEHSVFQSRIYQIKFLKPNSKRIFLVSGLIFVNKN